MPIVESPMAVGMDSPGGDLRSRVRSTPILNRDFIVRGAVGIEHSVAAEYAAAAKVGCTRELRSSLLDDAGLKEHAVDFAEFAAKRTRGFVAKSFYHLLGSAALARAL